MKVPLSWLRDYIPHDLPVPELAERLTLAGLEVASVRLIGVPPPEGLRFKIEDPGPVWDPDKVFVARVLEVKPHPDADRLRLPVVDYGQGRTKEMVTGAPNLNVGDAGQKVVLALSGSVLYDTHVTPKALKALKPTKIRGVPSDAMVCSESELGISDEHEGIILLEDEAPVGTPLVEYMGDVVLELDITPNLARCLSLIGIAREVAALTGKKVQLPSPGVEARGKPIEGQVKVVIEDPALSRRYAAALLEDITVGPSPCWMQRRLTYAGMRPINNIVDVTNYVMLEWGQPLHAFDHDILVQRAGGKAPTISVRRARQGEKLRTLDDVDRNLTPDMLIIADEKGPIALAGVMGGAETEVTATTKRVLLESANFDFLITRRTMRDLNLPSEASTRFSRGIHPELVRPAVERAADLMRQHAGASVCQGLVDNYPAPLQPQVIDLPMAEVQRLLGIALPIEECARILEALEFQVEQGQDSLRVTTPPHRLDIQEGAADLIEDLIRLYGYDRLPETLLADQLPAQATNEPLVFEDTVKDRLVACGLQEVITYALTTPEREAPLGGQRKDMYIRLLNPINSDRVVLRHSVLPEVITVARENLKHSPSVALFEVGSVYALHEEKKLPDEPRRLALVMSGRRHPEFWNESSEAKAAYDFFDLKGIIESLIEDLHLPEVRYRSAKIPPLHPGKGAEVMVGKRTAGWFGEMHPRAVEAYELSGRRVLIGELDLEVLRAAVPHRHLYQAVPRFPAALRDIAVVVSEEVSAERIEQEIRVGGGNLLREVHLFDLYRGDSIAAGQKSLAYALCYQADDRTLTDKEVDKAHGKIEKRLQQTLQAQIRGKEGSN